ncbi:substrate-binding periplasmic protein [Undibacterium fentianense]|uniref:Transporter substrate-binding domain-containing protein n=1 Tax=Undibacterium fentianense TaxID=2828728 RepID=A0A941IFG7_9BURK|nr:transporter substrate-binding domain-containing protein [Undibacterium fentianense]MBR7800357.1 transporter substrate-binding domain-containing protein [Undibacterium fentianense]
MAIRRSILSFAICLLGIVCNAKLQAQELVHLQTIEEFDSQGRPVPIGKTNVDLLSFLEKSLSIKISVKRVPWKRAMDNALHNDILLMGMSITQERAKKYSFSDPINANGNWLITRCDASFKFNTLQDLKGKRIGIVIGTSAGEEFDKQINVLFQIDNDSGAGISRLQKLLAKRTDAIIWYGVTTDVREMQSVINQRFAEWDSVNSKLNPQPFCVLPKPISIVYNHFAMRTNEANKKLLARINQAMAKGRKEGAIPSLRATILD